MPLSTRHKLSRLPKRFPVGTTFVVEGRTIAADGKNDEQLRVFSRFVVLPGGRRIDLGGDAVIIRGPDGVEIGRGLCAYDAEDAQKIRGRSSADIDAILGFSGRAEMVHRDDLVVGRE